MKYQWIKEHRLSHGWDILKMCRVLQVSSTGYYDWLKREPSRRAQSNAALDEKIVEIYKEHRGRYGALRILRDLIVAGFHCSLNRVKRRMQKLKLKSIIKRKFKVTTDSKHSLPVAPNLLQRDFTASAPNQKWVGDITYVRTQQGWLYLAVVIDLYSRTVVGWAMSKRINKQLVCDALNKALWRQGFPKGVIMHTDRGSQYCSNKYQKMIKNHDLLCSMSRKGNCWDNAVAESFFKTLKVELIYQTTYKTREQAHQDIFEYIEVYYNRKRRHSALDYQTPNEVELKYLNAA